MSDCAITAEVFATVKVTKMVATSTPKPRMALIQEGENGVKIPNLSTAPSESVIRCKEPI
jgi:hypothetical protein